MALAVRFYLEKVEKRAPAATYNEVDPLVWIDEERVDIAIPGEREEVVTHIVNRDRLKSWRDSKDAGHNEIAVKYDRWKAGQAEPETGTPLELAGFLSPAMIENLKAPPRNCKTVEALADMSDPQGNGIPMFMAMRDKAKKFLEARSGPAAVAERMASQDATIASQQKQLAEVNGQLAELLKRLPVTGTAPVVREDPAILPASAVMPEDDPTAGAAGIVPADSAAVRRRRKAIDDEAEAA